jgi:hypothetical protein
MQEKNKAIISLYKDEVILKLKRGNTEVTVTYNKGYTAIPVNI